MNTNNPYPQLKLFLYNTATRQKQLVTPLRDNHIRLYTCGPTVYNYAHIGNFRTYIFEDLLRRTIKFFGMKITQVMNLTDVDDKTIRGAIEKGVSLIEFTKPFKEAFFEDIKTLGMESAEHYPAATDYIPEMIEMIQTLLDKGYAYKASDQSIYFAIHKFPSYGCLSHLKLEELKVGSSGVAVDEYEKEHAADFVLWKHYDKERDGNIFWESPFGKGRPGWHLECSAMAIKLLGETLDIHVGGIDNMFPHHENEIAQSEGCSGKAFVKIWMHAEHLIVDGKKMSKSLNNFYTLRDLLQRGYTGTQIRYLLLQTHYKTQLNFTFNGLDAAKGSLDRLNSFILRIQEIRQEESKKDINPIIQNSERAFAEALSDDLNISAALAALFEMVREINVLCDNQEVSAQDAAKVLSTLKHFNQVLGVLDFEERLEVIPEELQAALIKREQARKDKDWALADTLRDYIASHGYLIEDTPQGRRLKKMDKK